MASKKEAASGAGAKWAKRGAWIAIAAALVAWLVYAWMPKPLVADLAQVTRNRLEITVDEDLIENLIAQCASRSDEGARVCGKLVGNLVVGPIIDFFVQEGNRSVRAARVQQSEKAGGVEVVREVRRD